MNGTSRGSAKGILQALKQKISAWKFSSRRPEFLSVGKGGALMPILLALLLWLPSDGAQAQRIVPIPIPRPDPAAAPAPDSVVPPDSVAAESATAEEATADAEGIKPDPTKQKPERIIDPNAETVVLQGLDKVTARIEQLLLPVNEPLVFGTLTLKARACGKRRPEETPEVAAFLEIDEQRPGEQQVRLFTGWMFSSSPGLNPLEHAIYDVWVIDCRNPSTRVPVASSSE